MRNNQSIDTNKITKQEGTTTTIRGKYVFCRPCTRHHAMSYPHQTALNKTHEKSIRQYLHEINDTPTQACIICEMLCFNKHILKVTSAFVKDFFVLSLQLATKIIATSNLVCTRCVDDIVNDNIPDHVAPWNISRNK